VDVSSAQQSAQRFIQGAACFHQFGKGCEHPLLPSRRGANAPYDAAHNGPLEVPLAGSRTSNSTFNLPVAGIARKIDHRKTTFLKIA